MWGTVKIEAVVLLLILAAALVLMLWVLCKADKEEFSEKNAADGPSVTPVPTEKIEGPCESCVRYDECQAVDESCPVRR